MSQGRALRLVARKACGSSSPLGSRTRSQRIGTRGTPARYHMAVPVTISTRRLVRPYHRLTRVALPGDFAILDHSGQLFQTLALDRPAAPAFALLRWEAKQVGGEAQAGDDTSMAANSSEEFDGCKRTVGDQDNIAIGKP